MLSCDREARVPVVEKRVPDGTPVMFEIGFGIPDFYDVRIGTRSEASRTDESHVHDLYVMLFDPDDGGVKFYGRYFTYEHLINSLSTLDAGNNEGWYVENSENSRGVVKIATESRPNATLVVLANVSNTISTLNGMDAVDCLAGIDDLNELNQVRVTLEQEIVNRTDLFLMMGHAEGVDTGNLKWGGMDGGNAVYDKIEDHYQLRLYTLDAKVKFCIKYDTTNIDPDRSTPRYWQVHNVPAESFLFPRESNPEDVEYFNTEEAYFEGTETIAGEEYEVFSFYMLENRQAPLRTIDGDYYLREKETDPSLKEANFIYAPPKGTYVQFDIVLGLTTTGVGNILGASDINHALTSEALYTIHLGDFTSSEAGSGHNYNNYNVERSTFYTYYVTIENSKSIYVEVIGEGEPPQRIESEPGQEGSLLLSTDEIVNCDAHYEYHCLTFRYTPALEGKEVSWYVKTPFDEGGARWNPSAEDWDFDCDDYLWVKFGLNVVSGGTYSENRRSYPGDTYDAGWDPKTSLSSDQLVDIHQLFSYIINQTKRRNAGQSNDFMYDPSAGDSGEYVIRFTAFVDEYYYESDPRPGRATEQADPDLWRSFVNAKPRELHILSDAHYSEDGQSDVITSSHSIIQRSIQTFYNIYSPDLSTLWGTEHLDEMEYRIRKAKNDGQEIWPWWPSGRTFPSSVKFDDDENGRINTSKIWGIKDHPAWDAADAPRWDTFLDYSVNNNTPELQDDYKYLAYSCLTRNRDNNGNGVIDPEELRWYIASVNQLVGMWVGNNALTPSARIYQPADKSDRSAEGLNWRAWVISSTATSITNPKTIRAEEAATKSDYNTYNWMLSPQRTFTETDRHQVSSVRCVRNIGTYSNAGRIEDISSAPFDRMVDQYYEAPQGMDSNGKVNPNADGTYTLRFSRLNPKSLREFTTEDLPFHEEYSMHNCVYLELNMQNPDDYVYADGSMPADDAEQINHNITADGYNKYCPPGYRLPNMTELLLMSSLQPSGYWTSNCEYPCRTYFSRGKLGSKQTPGEAVKIGWGYTVHTDRVHMLHENNAVSGMRCVRDLNRTGEITGKISVPDGDKLHLGDDITIKLNITSMGSAVKSINLSLVYVNTSGEENTVAIPTTGISLAGVSIRDAEVHYTLPSDLPILGNMCVRASVRNNAGVSKILEAPIRVLSNSFASVRLLPCKYDDSLDNPPFPVMVTASSPSSDIVRWKLSVTDPYNEVFEYNLSPDNRDARHWSSIFQYRYTLDNLLPGSYSFQLEVVTADGKAIRSDFARMDVLKVNYHPNPGTSGPGGDYEESGDIINIWEAQKVDGIHFYTGDFIEADLDVSTCTYHEVMQIADPSKRDDARTLGRDNLISVGITDTDHSSGMTVPNVFHIFYPAHDGSASSGKDWLRPNISNAAGGSNGYNYKAFRGGAGSGFTLVSGNDYKPDISARQHFRLDRNGAFWNGQNLSLSTWGDPVSAEAAANASASMGRILNSTTLYVGATQGLHRSRARYCFVRAVYNSESGNAAGGGSDFENNPINGGNL